MSANNFIYIQEKVDKDKRRYFMVVMKDADNWVSFGKTIRCVDLRSAIEEANRIQSEEEVEYGISVSLLEKEEE